MKIAWKTLILWGIALSLFFAGLIILWVATLQVPDLQSFEKRKVEQSTKIYDKTGEVLLYDLHEDIQRTVVPFDSISRHIKNATVAIEDAEFYEHKGIKPMSILRAVIANTLIVLHISDGYTQGGSTITQQVVKNSVLTQEKLLSRKLKEWGLALKLEKEMSKEQILELYLNESPYGGSMYGVEEASKAFFGKSANEVTLPEAAYLAALPQAPTYYSPYGTHRDALEARKNLVLEKMLENGFITDTEFKEARMAEVEFKQRPKTGIEAPHFVFFVIAQLEEMYGKRALEERGFRVTTTLDVNLQRKGEEIVRRNALENVEKFNAENAALVAIDPKTGHILTMVGSRDYFDEEIDGNFNIAIANRQPGSAFKPFVYATAFKKGFTPETVVFDVRTQFSTTCSPNNFTSEGSCYSPGNYDNIFRGPVTFRDALAQSINVPAVKALYLAGISDSLKTARDLGISTLTNAARYGLTLVLGGGEVSLLDMTSAYSVFANDGARNEYVGILKVEDAHGDVVYMWEKNEREVLDKEIARKISDILSDNDARAPAFGTNSPLYFGGRDVAAKTGTTNDYRDAWIIGYAPNIAVGAWAGNNDNSPMEKKVAGFTIAPLWHEFMNAALATLQNESFVPPLPPEDLENTKPILKNVWLGGEQYVIDTISGKLATQYTPQETRETRVIPNVHSILYWVDKKDPTGVKPSDPSKDPQFTLWEFPVLLWANQNGYTNQHVSIPTETDDVHLPETTPVVSFISPEQNGVYAPNTPVSVRINTTGRYPVVRADYYLNNVFIGSSTHAPFSVSIHPQAGLNTLSVKVFDSVKNQNSAQITFSSR